MPQTIRFNVYLAITDGMEYPIHVPRPFKKIINIFTNVFLGNVDVPVMVYGHQMPGGLKYPTASLVAR